jgi:uncharacterized protein (DUF1697 family)
MTNGKFVVLLRGVNVGKGNRVPMAQFKQGLEELGYTDVVTILNSGNALFSSPTKAITKHVKAISQLLIEQFHISTPVIVLPASLFAAIVEENPIVPAEGDHSKFLVAFAQDAENIAELAKSIPQTKLPDRFAVAHHAAYLYCPDGILQSATANAFVGKAGRNVTTRNWATVLKLHKLLTKA